MPQVTRSVRGPGSPFAAAGFRARLAAVSIAALIAAGCGSSTAPPSPTPAPSTVAQASLDPHLHAPVSADQVFVALGGANLGLVATSANAGRGSGVVKEIYADVGSWPLRITQYTDATALRNVVRWKAGSAPGRNEAPYAFVGLNVLVQYGPLSPTRAPARPDSSRQAWAAKIVAVLDPLLSPLAQHSVVAIATQTAAPSVAPSPAPTKAPTKAPAKTPKPSKHP
jgi:hypothetical protein